MQTVNPILCKGVDESIDAYKVRLCRNKDAYQLSWSGISRLIYDNTNEYHDESYYRKRFGKIKDVLKMGEQPKQLYMDLRGQENNPNLKRTPTCTNNCADEDTVVEDGNEDPIDEIKQELQETLFAIKKERVKLSDERAQNNALIRIMSREETLKEIATSVAESLNERIILDIPIKKFNTNDTKHRRVGVLEISDWHYGIDVNNYFNTYNPEITKQCVKKLRDEVLNKCAELGISELNVCNLGDMIAGRIHSQIRINSRFDVITQQMHVSEILAEFLTDLSTGCGDKKRALKINYRDCLDNHSRIEPNKKESLQLETLARMTPWFLKTRIKDNPNITIYDNDIGFDIMKFEVLGWKFVGVHGDLDKPKSAVTNLSMFTKDFADVYMSAHFHRFSSDERNQCLLVSNGSMMGVDDLSYTLRLTSTPSQNLIVVNENNPLEFISRLICR